MHDGDTQCTVEGREEAKGQRKFFYVQIFFDLPYLEYEFLFHQYIIFKDPRKQPEDQGRQKREEDTTGQHSINRSILIVCPWGTWQPPGTKVEMNLILPCSEGWASSSLWSHLGLRREYGQIHTVLCFQLAGLQFSASRADLQPALPSTPCALCPPRGRGGIRSVGGRRQREGIGGYTYAYS